MYDLLIKGGRVIDPSQGLDASLDLAISQGKIVELEEGLGDEAYTLIDASDLIVTPGLIDLHVHAYWGVSHFGIIHDPYCIGRGVTTAVDAGSSGASTFPGFRRYVVEASRTRLYAFLNISAMGMITPGIEEVEELRYLKKDMAIDVADRNRDLIKGIKIRLSKYIARDHDLKALEIAVDVAEELDMPVMVHIGASHSPLPNILSIMRKGDIITHCFTGLEHGILNPEGGILDEVFEAVERGIILDVGHGMGSFAFHVAEKAIKANLLPETISSDLHTYNIHGPVFDLATTISKFLNLGLPLEEAIKRVTLNPARILGIDTFTGALKRGYEADIALFNLVKGEFPFKDATGETRIGEWRLIPRMTIKGGEPYAIPGDALHMVTRKLPF